MKKLKKKIAIILTDLGGGGTERMRIYLSKEFLKNGYTVEFVLFHKKGALLPIVPKEVTIVDLKAKKLRSGFWPLVRYFRENKPDTILAGMWPVTVIVPWAKFISRIKATVVVSEHTMFSDSPVYKRRLNHFILPLTMRLSYPMAKAVIGVSNGVVDDVKQLSKSKGARFVTIYNPACPDIDEVEATPPNQIFWKSKNSKRIIAVGALKKAKDYPTLLRAFRLVRQVADAELLILGEGPERNSIEGLLREYSLQNYVHLPGFVNNPIPYLKSSDLFVMTSAWEGFGNVVVEALACGVPVVSTDCPSGPSEILEDGKYGGLVPVGDDEALSRAIITSLQKEHDSMMLIERAKEFAADKIAKQYLELLFPIG